MSFVRSSRNNHELKSFFKNFLNHSNENVLNNCAINCTGSTFDFTEDSQNGAFYMFCFVIIYLFIECTNSYKKY